MSIRLAEMLERRSALLNHSCHFYCERMHSLTDFIDDAGEVNTHFQLYLKPELQPFKRYDLKYWPSIADILRSLGMEDVNVACADEATEAIIKARRPSLTDFLRGLFNRIDEHQTDHWYSLPRTFKLSDAALATICNITRDLPPGLGYWCRLRETYPSSAEGTGGQRGMVNCIYSFPRFHGRGILMTA